MLAEGMAEKIISMYALGTGTRAIGDWMEENLGNRLSGDNQLNNRPCTSGNKDMALPLFGSGLCHCLDGCHPLQSHGRERLCRYPCHL